MLMISFVIAVYNNEKYLSNAVRSITNQTLDDKNSIEIIIVDDGSTDNTAAIADDLSTKDDRITVIHQSNQWIYASFNNGIKSARGEYIYILNSDDKMADGSVQLLIDSVKKNNMPDVVWTKILWRAVDENQITLYERDINSSIIKDEYVNTLSGIHDKWLKIYRAGLTVNQANLYKRDIALAHPFRNDVYGADTFFNLSIADEIKSMLILKDNIYLYYAYNNSEMNASLGKYYEYDHDMFTEMMHEEINLYKKWNCNKDFLDFAVLKRLRGVTHEIKALGFSNCTLTWEQKIKKIFEEIADKEIRLYSCEVGREREYESRILNGTKELLINNKVKKIPSFVKTLISNLPENYMDNIDRNHMDKAAIFSAVHNDINKDMIGIKYYSEDW